MAMVMSSSIAAHQKLDTWGRQRTRYTPFRDGVLTNGLLWPSGIRFAKSSGSMHNPSRQVQVFGSEL